MPMEHADSTNQHTYAVFTRHDATSPQLRPVEHFRMAVGSIGVMVVLSHIVTPGPHVPSSSDEDPTGSKKSLRSWGQSLKNVRILSVVILYVHPTVKWVATLGHQ